MCVSVLRMGGFFYALVKFVILLQLSHILQEQRVWFIQPFSVCITLYNVHNNMLKLTT